MRIKIWRVIVILVLLLLISSAAYVFWPTTASLDYLLEAGEGYDVRILRDSWGVPHIFGETDADTAFGLAFAHAEDDFYTIQQNAAAALGKLAQSQGVDMAPIDYMSQLLRVGDVVEEKYHTLWSVSVSS